MGGRAAPGCDAGGIRGLRLVLAEHAEAIEADFARYYGTHLARDLGTERLTYRRFGVLLRRLPRESNYVQEIGGPSLAWTHTEHLLAAVVNELRVLDWHYLSAHTPKNSAKPKKPRFVEAPGARQSSKPKMSLTEMRGRLADPRWVDADDTPKKVG